MVPYARKVQDILGAAQAEGPEEHHEALLDGLWVVGRLFEGIADPAAKDGGLVEGVGADEREEGAEVGQLVLDGSSGEAPPGVGVERTAGAV